VFNIGGDDIRLQLLIGRLVNVADRHGSTFASFEPLKAASDFPHGGVSLFL
jgi:hypothetical protein